MSLPFKRALAVGTTAALALLSLFIVPAHSAPTSTPTTCAGVWVVVQDDQTNPASSIGCATTFATGLDALQSAGFTGTVDAGLLVTIDGLTGTSGFYWSYWYATVNADGTLGAWAYYTDGPASTKPSKGVAEGYMLTNDWHLTPGATRVFTPAASTSPSASASSSASVSAPVSSASTSASTAPSAAGASVTSAASPPSQSPEVLSAAGYLSKNLPPVDNGTGALVGEALGLSAARSCAYSSSLASLVASIKAQAADYVGNSPGRAAYVAILAVTLGEDPTSFGGLNLVDLITVDNNGQVGPYPDAFAQSLAIIAYVRAGHPVSADMLTTLASMQDASGAFGYEYKGFNPDYDTTGLAIEALSAGHGDSGVLSKAVHWALAEQSGGYWPNTYSPVDSTGILGSALEFAGTSSGGALGWLQLQQLADGGFPSSAGGTTSDVAATADALWLLAGTNFVTVSAVQGCDPSTTGGTIATKTAAATLAETGSPVDGPMGALAVAMLVVGSGALVLRRRLRRV